MKKFTPTSTEINSLVAAATKELALINASVFVTYDATHITNFIGVMRSFNNRLFKYYVSVDLYVVDSVEKLRENQLKLKNLNMPEIIEQVVSQMSDETLKQLFAISCKHLMDYMFACDICFDEEADILGNVYLLLKKSQMYNACFSFEVIKNDSRCAKEIDGIEQELLSYATIANFIHCLDQSNDLFAYKIGLMALETLKTSKLDMYVVNFFALLDYMYGSAGLGTAAFSYTDCLDFIDWRGFVSNYKQYEFKNSKVLPDDMRTLSCLNFVTIGMLLQTLGIIQSYGPLLKDTELELSANYNTEIYNYFDYLSDVFENTDPFRENCIVDEKPFPYDRELFAYEKNIVETQLKQEFFYLINSSSFKHCLYVPYELLAPVVEFFETTPKQAAERIQDLLYELYCQIAIDILEFVLENKYEAEYGLTPLYSAIDYSLAGTSVSLYLLLDLCKRNSFSRFWSKGMPLHLFHPAIFAILALDQKKSVYLVNKILTTVLKLFAKPNKYTFFGEVLYRKINTYIAKRPRKEIDVIDQFIDTFDRKMWNVCYSWHNSADLAVFYSRKDLRLFSIIPSYCKQHNLVFNGIESFIGKLALAYSKFVHPWLAVNSLIKMLHADARLGSKNLPTVYEKTVTEKQRLYTAFAKKKECNHYFEGLHEFVFTSISDSFKDFVCILADSFIYNSFVKRMEKQTFRLKESLNIESYRLLTAYLPALPVANILPCRLSQLPANLTIYRCIAAVEHFQIKEFLDFVQFATSPEQLCEATASASVLQVLKQIAFLDLSTPEKKKLAHCVVQKLLLNVKENAQRPENPVAYIAERYKYAYYVNGKKMLGPAWKLYIYLQQTEHSASVALLDAFVQAVKAFGEVTPSWKAYRFDSSYFYSLERLICRSLECLDQEGIRLIEYIWPYKELAVEYGADRAEFKLYEKYIELPMPTCVIDISPEDFSTYFEASRSTDFCFAETKPCFAKYKTSAHNLELFKKLRPIVYACLFETLIAYMFGYILQEDANTESTKLNIARNFLYFAYWSQFFIAQPGVLREKLDALVRSYTIAFDTTIPLSHMFSSVYIYVMRYVLYYLSSSSPDELIHMLLANGFFDFYRKVNKKTKCFVEVLNQRLLAAIKGEPVDCSYKDQQDLNSLLGEFERVFSSSDNSNNYVLLHNNVASEEVEMFVKRNGLILLYFKPKPTEIMKPTAGPAYYKVADGRQTDAFAPVYYQPGQAVYYYAQTKAGNLTTTQSAVYNQYALPMYANFQPIAEPMPPTTYFSNSYHNSYYSTGPYPFNAAGAPTVQVWSVSQPSTNYPQNSGSDASYQQFWNYYGQSSAANVGGNMGYYAEGVQYGVKNTQKLIKEQNVFYNPYGEFYASRIKIYESYKVEDEDVLDMRHIFTDARNYFQALNLLPLDAHKIFCIAKGLALNTVLLPFTIPSADFECFMSLITHFPAIYTKVSESIVDMNSPLLERHYITVVSKPPHGLGEIILTPPLAHLLEKAGITQIDLQKIYREEDFVCELYLAVFKTRVLLYPSRSGEVGGNVYLSCGCFVPVAQIITVGVLAQQLTPSKMLRYLLQYEYRCPNCRKVVFIARRTSERKIRSSSANYLSISHFGCADESSLILLVDGFGYARVDYLHRYGFFNQFLDYWL